jgi:hypothetical protein
LDAVFLSFELVPDLTHYIELRLQFQVLVTDFLKRSHKLLLVGVSGLAAPRSPLLSEVRPIVFVCRALADHLLDVLVHRILQLGIWNDLVLQRPATILEV